MIKLAKTSDLASVANLFGVISQARRR